MKMCCLVGAMLVLASRVNAAGPAPSLSPQAAFVSDLLSQSVGESEVVNRVWSTYPVYESLLLLHAGSAGETRRELAALLHLPNDAANPQALISASRMASLRLVPTLPIVIRDNDGYGVKVVSAEKQVVRPGDLIFSVNDVPVRKAAEVMQEVRLARSSVRISGYELESGTMFQDRTLALEKVRQAIPAPDQPPLLSFGTALGWDERSGAVADHFRELMEANRALMLPFDGQMPKEAQKRLNEYFAGIAGRDISLKLPPPPPEPTMMFLVTACRMEALWERPFHNATDRFPFQTPQGSRDVVAMSVTSTFPHREAASYEMIDVSYRQSSLSMRLVLPKTRGGVVDLLKREVLGEILRWSPVADEGMSVEITMPLFRLDAVNTMKPTLSRMGARSAFTPAADFSGIFADKGMMLHEVQDQVRLEVDQKGTKAVAIVTAVGVPKSLPPEAKPFLLNRPFLCFVRDGSGTVFFAGLVANPSAPGILNGDK